MENLFCARFARARARAAQVPLELWRCFDLPENRSVLSRDEDLFGTKVSLRALAGVVWLFSSSLHCQLINVEPLWALHTQLSAQFSEI